MLRVMLQKVWHKKWVCSCLLMGIVFLIAVAVSFPMYRTAAFDRMVREEFEQAYAQSGEWPAVNRLSYTANRDEKGATIQRIENFVRGMQDQLGVTGRDIVTYYVTAKADARSLMDREDVDTLPLRVSFLSDLESHVHLLEGEMFSESGFDQEGNVEALISSACMMNSMLLLGETVEFPTLKDPAGNPLHVRITGVFEAEDISDPYWQISPDSLTNNCMIREEIFRDYFTLERAENFNLVCNYFPIWEYEDLKASEVSGVYNGTKEMAEEGAYKSLFSEPPYLTILESYMHKEQRINGVLLLLLVPVWVLLGAFLFMISSQVYEIEDNEISVTRSRGGSGIQVFLLYLYQSIFLTLIGAVIGMPLGKLFARMLGATGGFLEFRPDRSLNVEYTGESFQYLLVAMLGCVLMLALPAIRHSRLTIVKLKRQKASFQWSWWEKCFLDVILLALSIAGYYLCLQMEPLVALGAPDGEAQTPLLYVDSSLFIVGAGLLLLRLQPFIVRLAFALGKGVWGPASYISFMENRKNGRKQHFIILFLILSISLGMYHSTVARSILQNAKENTEYIDGADMVLKEVWEDNSAFSYEGVAAKLEYYEPDYDKYRSLPGAVSYTKVVWDPGAHLFGGGGAQTITLMGIHTKQFGQNTWLSEELLGRHYYDYLNELSAVPKGALVSANFRDILGYKAGDQLALSNRDGKSVSCQILDFIEYWPGYIPSLAAENADGSRTLNPQYLVVTNIAALTKQTGTVPYEVWVTLEGEPDTGGFNQWIQEQDVRLEKYVNRQKDVEAVEKDPLLQGTNGILTMGFLVTMILCAAGYLIYWILSIRSREMMFGILRAEGMRRGEIFHILINEQIFCGGFAVLAGTGVGIASSRMFVPLLQNTYASADQALPMRLITSSLDMLRLYGVIGAVMLVCLVILVVLVRKLNVAKAIKLGEE